MNDNGKGSIEISSKEIQKIMPDILEVITKHHVLKSSESNTQETISFIHACSMELMKFSIHLCKKHGATYGGKEDE